MPTVSFVIPTRNQAAWLGRCLESCLAQGIPGAEILVIDGQSTDGTVEVLRRYGDRIRWTSEPDSGQAEAVNKGVSRASGEIIAWINSDDAYADPGAVRAALEVFEREAEVDLVYGDAEVIDAEGRPLRRYARRSFRGAADVLVAPIGPAQPAVLFRRALFLAAGGLRPELHYALDYDLMIRLFGGARRVHRLPRTLARMTFHPGAKSIRAMGEQIREAIAVKRRHAPAHALGPVARARLWAGVLSLHAYRAAVQLRLRRAA